jgi:hypothetical protein
MIADNRLTETSIWDNRLLAEQLKDLSVLDLHFSLDATGFEIAEIDLRIESLTSAEYDAADRADALPSPSARRADQQSRRLVVIGPAQNLLRERIGCAQ